MAEQAQSNRPTEEKQEVQPAATQAQADDETLDDIDLDISDLVEASKNLARNYKQKGGQ